MSSAVELSTVVVVFAELSNTYESPVVAVTVAVFEIDDISGTAGAITTRLIVGAMPTGSDARVHVTVAPNRPQVHPAPETLTNVAPLISSESDTVRPIASPG